MSPVAAARAKRPRPEGVCEDRESRDLEDEQNARYRHPQRGDGDEDAAR